MGAPTPPQAPTPGGLTPTTPLPTLLARPAHAPAQILSEASERLGQGTIRVDRLRSRLRRLPSPDPETKPERRMTRPSTSPPSTCHLDSSTSDSSYHKRNQPPRSAGALLHLRSGAFRHVACGPREHDLITPRGTPLPSTHVTVVGGATQRPLPQATRCMVRTSPETQGLGCALPFQVDRHS